MKTSIAVADRYDYVVGVDTHAASHAYAVVATGTGRLLAERSFPTTTAGRSRAATWITKHTRQTPHGVLVAMEGTGSYGATLSADLLEAGYRVVEAPTPERSRRKAKTDLDALVSEVGEDDVARAEKELDKLTKQFVDRIDDALKAKEADLLEV